MNHVLLRHQFYRGRRPGCRDGYRFISIGAYDFGAATLSIIAFSHVGGVEALQAVRVADTPPATDLEADASVRFGHALVCVRARVSVLSLWFWCSDQTIVQRALMPGTFGRARRGPCSAGS